jgi:hypothetical protein
MELADVGVVEVQICIGMAAQDSKRLMEAPAQRFGPLWTGDD